MADVTGTLSRRERERLRRRQAILSAARAVFAERGYEQATLDEVAARAEFGKGTLYNYFNGGKQGILFAIFDEVFNDLRSLMKETLGPEACRGRAFRDVFLDFATAVFTFFGEHQDLFMILVKESQHMIFSADEAKAAYFMQQQEETIEVLSRAIERAMADEEIRTLPAHSVAHVVIGNIQFLHMHQCMADRMCHGHSDALGPPEDSAHFLTNLIFDGLQGAPHSEAIESHQ